MGEMLPVHPYEPASPSPFDAAENLLLNADASATSSLWLSPPQFAVNGRHAVASENWASEDLPATLSLDLRELREMNAIRIWTYWDDRRAYSYTIEASPDGEQWEVLVDCRDSATTATAEGQTHLFEPRLVRQLRIVFSQSTAAEDRRAHVVEIEAYRLQDDDVARLRAEAAQWTEAGPSLCGAVGSVDSRYLRQACPGGLLGKAGKTWSAAAWKGERVHWQLVLWSAAAQSQLRLEVSPLRTVSGGTIPAAAVRARFVRYVLAEGELAGDVLDTSERIDMPARSVRPLWISVDVPPGAEAGDYQGTLVCRAAGGQEIRFQIDLEVLPLVLPPPADWRFHLDLWQNPYSVARYHHVAPWSDAHFQSMEPYLRLLAGCGAKALTTTIVHQPWGTQTYDPYDSMVNWIREVDGSWRWDYLILDRYIEFGSRCGLDGVISCYSMIPWTRVVRYYDSASGEYREAPCRPGESSFDTLWRPFLADFRRHAAERGFLDRIQIGFDELPLDVIEPVAALLKEVAPEFKVELAGHNDPKFDSLVDDWCLGITPNPLEPALARARTAAGKKTSFYVCCAPERPNTFTFSPPAEAVWLGIYAAARDYSGFKRWAYNCWTEDPLRDTNHVTWPAGDCFLVYPGPLSSIRFERLREGIQAFEKIRILRDMSATADGEDIAHARGRLEQALAKFSYESAAASATAAENVVKPALGAIEDLSRAMARVGADQPAGR